MKLKTRPAINKTSNIQIAFMATEALWNNKLRTN
jgi:putative ABC transport system permease protein